MPLRRLLFELSRCVAVAVTAVDGQKSGDGRARTGDPLLAKQVLSQLSYTPTVGPAFILKHFEAARKLARSMVPHIRSCPDQVVERPHQLDDIIPWRQR